ncbi:MAG: hypothetical protein WCK00_15315 [Deltaproteobacteria bacterium]
MTRIIIETDDVWTIGRISNAINAEILLLQRSVARTQGKIARFAGKYGITNDRSILYGHVDDMELIEWEGEIETLNKLQEKLHSLEDIRIEERR